MVILTARIIDYVPSIVAHRCQSKKVFSSTNNNLKKYKYISFLFIVFLFVFFNLKNQKLPTDHCCQNSNLVVSLFKNISKYCFNVKNSQLNYFLKNRNKWKVAMAHCCQSSNLAFILFDGKNFFLRFLVLFLRSLVALAICKNLEGSISPCSFDGLMS